MNLKILWIGAICLLVVGASIAVIVMSDTKPERGIVSQGSSEPAENIPRPENGTQETSQVQAEAVNSVSLPAFAEKTFDGRDFTVGRVLEENASYTKHFITYKSGNLTISGIMNVPKGDGPFPVLLLNHGYIDPAVYTNGRGLRREQDYLARQGYVIIHSDYRNHAQSDDDPNTETSLRLGYAEDVVNAIYALRAAKLPYVDVERVGMLGHSMGGGVALAIMTTQPDLVDAYVLFAPVSADVRDNFYRWTTERRDVADRILVTHGSPDENPEFWNNISPITFLDKVSSPIMIHHGTSDADVPLEWSQKLDQELQKNNKESFFHVYPGEPHEFAAAWPQVMQRTTIFFDEQVKRK